MGSKRYRVSIPWHATIFVEVRAESEEEAVEVAVSTCAAPSLCYSCARKVELGEYNDNVAPEVGLA